MVRASSSCFTVMFSVCLDPLKDKFSKSSFCRRVLYQFWMLVVTGSSHLYCNRRYLCGGVVVLVVGMLAFDVGMYEFLV